MSDVFRRLAAPMHRRIQNMVARAVVTLVNDATKAQALQLSVTADEGHDDVERFQNYGFTSVPHPGAEAAVMFVGGLRSHGIVVAVEDRRYRLTGLQGGEVALYDDLDQVVKLSRTGIEVTTPLDIDIGGKTVTVHATTASVIADNLSLGGNAGTIGVARIGDKVVDGVITTGSTKVTAA